MPTEFGELFRRFREEAGMSMGQVARQLGISVPYLSDVERGNRGPLAEERIRAAAAFLGITAEKCQRLLSASAESRGYFELSARNLSPSKEALGAALARSWNELEESQVREIKQVLEGVSRK